MADPYHFSLNQTMLRIKDPEKSIPFYTKYFGMILIQERHFPDAKFSLYFLVTVPEGQIAPPLGTDEAEEYYRSGKYGVTLELTHNHGTEKDPDFHYHDGNSEPRGYGHIGFLVDDVYSFCDMLDKEGVRFRKRPDDGNMKGLAFVLDPDGYSVEIIKRDASARVKGRPTFQQTMIRVKDGEASMRFYRDICHMTLVDKMDFPQWKFTLYFMATIPEEERASLPEPGTEAAHHWLWGYEGQTLELTHNHGTENEPDFHYNNGNVEPYRGFGHIAFMVDDVYAACAEMDKKGVKFQKKPDEGRMKGLAFALDPDGYWVEIVKRGPKGA